MLAENVARYGVGQASTADLIATIFGERAGKALASRTLSQLAEMAVPELEELHGIGPALAVRVHAVIEMARRIATDKVKLGERMSCSDDVGRYFQRRIGHERAENLYGVYLDSNNTILKVELLAKGGINAVSVHPREIFAPAIKERAVGLILVHNHPTGNLTLSDIDRRFRDRVRQGGELIGVALIDFMIVTRSSYQSFMA